MCRYLGALLNTGLLYCTLLNQKNQFQTDGRIHRRGARENKFGLLRTEIFRITRKQIKKQEDSSTGQFADKIFRVILLK